MNDNTQGDGKNLFPNAIACIGRLGEKVIPVLSEKERGLLLLATLVAILSLPGSGFLLWKDQYAWAFAIFCLAIGFFVVVVFAILRSQAQRADGTSPVVPAWTRLVPRLPIPENKLAELSEELEDIRKHAFAKIREIQPATSISQDDVRANVFLPDASNAAIGEVCSLYIPKNLHSGMNDASEREIRFRPNEGLTGRVFCRQRPLGAIVEVTQHGDDWTAIPVHDDDTSVDTRSFELTGDQRNRISSDLQWIVCFPLLAQSTQGRVAMGVLNIDGIHHAMDQRELKLLCGALMLKVVSYSEKLKQLPQTKLSILVEDQK